jgi:hypothetical protein
LEFGFAIPFIAANNRWQALTVVDPFDLLLTPYVPPKTNVIRDSRIASIHACSVIVEDYLPSDRRSSKYQTGTVPDEAS